MNSREQTVRDHAQILWEAASEDLRDARRQKAFIEFCKQAGLIYFAAEKYVQAAREKPELATLLDRYKRDVLTSALEMLPAQRGRKNSIESLKRFKTPFIIFIGILFFTMAVLLVMKLREVSVHLQSMGN